MKYKILFLSHEQGKGIGGSTYSLFQMIKSLEGKIDAVVVSRPGDALNFLREKGIKCYVPKFPIRLQVWYKKKSHWGIIERVIRIVYHYLMNVLASVCLFYRFRGKIDIVHTNSAVLDVGFIVAKFLHAKHVWHLREFMNLDHDLEPLLGWNRVYKLSQKSDAIVSISHSIAEHYRIDALGTVIYDAVFKEADIREIQAKEKYFLYAGGGKIKKGLFDAIRVFQFFSMEHPEYQLYITGNIKKEELVRLEKILMNNQNVVLLGFRPDLDELMRKASAFWMCSHFEALGRVTIEAMFYGCPVIGFDSAGTSELIQNGITGWLYKNDDDFLYCINKIVEDSNNTIETIVQQAQRFALETFSEEVYRKKIIDLYNNIMS